MKVTCLKSVLLLLKQNQIIFTFYEEILTAQLQRQSVKGWF